MKIILLPGLDGTGTLFENTVKALPNHIDIHVLALNTIQGDTYLEQADSIANSFAKTNIVIVAESYSGRIAYELCKQLENNVIGVVFIASFISRPSIISRFASFLPTFFLKPHPVTQYLISKLGFSGYGNQKLLEQVLNAISTVDVTLLKQRLQNIAKLKEPQKQFDMPTVYIRPHRDYFVTKNAINIVSSAFLNCKIIDVNGGHFIAQTNGNACAKIIEEQVNKLT